MYTAPTADHLTTPTLEDCTAATQAHTTYAAEELRAAEAEDAMYDRMDADARYYTGLFSDMEDAEAGAHWQESHVDGVTFNGAPLVKADWDHAANTD